LSINMDGNTGNLSMYREEHLQKKSDECADLWREWFSLWQKKHWVRQMPVGTGASVVMSSV